MAKRRKSAGLLMYRRHEGTLEVFLVHPGGPFWAKKDAGAWTIPKGEYGDDEEPLAAAMREFTEETGFAVGQPKFIELGTVTQASGKVVSGWAFEGDCDPTELISNRCMIEGPPRSGRIMEIPEADRGAWFSLDEAARRMNQGQQLFLSRLAAAI